MSTLNLMLINTIEASSRGSLRVSGGRKSLFADLKETEPEGKPQTLWWCFPNNDSHTWPNQMWKTVILAKENKIFKSEISYSCQSLTQTVAAAWTTYKGLDNYLLNFSH